MKLQELMDKKKFKRSLEAIVVAGVVLAGGYYAKQGGREDASSREDSTEQYGSRETGSAATTGKTAAPSLLELPAGQDAERRRLGNQIINGTGGSRLPSTVSG